MVMKETGMGEEKLMMMNKKKITITLIIIISTNAKINPTRNINLGFHRNHSKTYTLIRTKR